MYDFNAKVGEVSVFALSGTEGITDEIEYVRFRDGKFRKKYILTTGGILIEGLGIIGNQHGDILNTNVELAGCQRCLFTELVSVDDANSKWHSYPEEFEYRADLDDFASVEYVTAESTPKLTIRHENGLLTAESDCGCYDTAELTDTFGRTVASVDIALGEKSVSIPTSGLSTGVYIITLSNPSSQTSQKLFIR